MLAYILIVCLLFLFIFLYYKISTRDNYHSSVQTIPNSQLLDFSSIYNNFWKAVYNPSIIYDKNSFLLVARISNTTMCRDRLRREKNDPEIISSIITAKLDPRTYQLYDISNIYPIIKNTSKNIWGIEDPRIFHYNGQPYIIATIRKDGKFDYDTVISRLNISKSKFENMIKINPQFDRKNNAQKNWNPFIPEERLFITSISPHRIAQIDFGTGEAKLLYKTKNKFLEELFPGKHRLRGGTRPVLTLYGYLAIAHIRDGTRRGPKYSHIFYLIDNKPPYPIISISGLVCLDLCEPIQFVTGLEIHPDTKNLIITFGSMDCDSRMTIMPLENAVNIAKTFDVYDKTLIKHDTMIKRNIIGSSQKIPKIIIQTNESKYIPIKMKKAIDSIIRDNPEYDYLYFDAKARREFIKKNFDTIVLECYDVLNPGAYKADLFRYCVVYKLGGIYIDSGMSSLNPINSILQTDDEFVTPYDPPVSPTSDPGLYTAFICAVSNHPIIKYSIEDCILKIGQRDMSHPLAITGPILFGRAYKKYTNLNLSPNVRTGNINIIDHDTGPGKEIICNDRTCILKTKYPGYYDDMKWYHDKPAYSKLFEQGDVYLW